MSKVNWWRRQTKHEAATLRERWGDVVKWQSFWEELESLVLTLVRSAWMSGYRAGKRERL